MASCYLPTILPAHDTVRVIALAGALGGGYGRGTVRGVAAQARRQLQHPYVAR